VRVLAKIPDLPFPMDVSAFPLHGFGIGATADLYGRDRQCRSLHRRAGSRACEWRSDHGDRRGHQPGGFRRRLPLESCCATAETRLGAADGRVIAGAGAVLQDLVDFAIESAACRAWRRMAGIPGSVGAAVYGNAGAYGHSLSERVVNVRFHDGREIRTLANEACQFSGIRRVFSKSHKDWIVFSTELLLEPPMRPHCGRPPRTFSKMRNQKFPSP